MQVKNKAITIIPDKLYWISDVSPPNAKSSFYFNIDDQLQYQAFNRDFGPLNLGKTWKYVSQLQKLITNQQYKTSKIYHYTSTDFGKCANAAYLMGAFQIIILGYKAQRAYEPFKSINLVPFRDASYGDCTYKCTLLDCLRGLQYAMKLDWLNFKKFNLAEYEHYQKVDNGDLNWIIPGKFVAFSSPYDKKVDKYGYRTFTPSDYLPIFKKMNVKLVIRLNNKTYDQQQFIKAGIKHQDLFFTDGTAPSIEIVDKFLKIVEQEKGAVAVHCKAGLGRTGCLIGCYAMKHFKFPAADFIGWIRIARPGSILGPQQHFMIQKQSTMHNRSANSPIWAQIKQKVMQKETIEKLRSMSIKKNQMNQKQKNILKNGDIGQGQTLVEAKIRRNKIKSTHQTADNKK